MSDEMEKFGNECEARGEAKGIAKGIAKGRIGLISQFIKEYGVEKAKTMLKPSEDELKEALAMS